MELGSIAAVSALVISVCGFLMQGWKWIQEVRDRSEVERDAATKAEVERDNIAVKSAEGTLLMMQQLLEVTKMSEGELRERVRELERENRDKERQLQELSYQSYLKDQELALQQKKIEELQTRLNELEARIAEQERKNG
jgi:predicted RNase H-like nuclease (RuvC/YqgF family)